MNTSLFQTVILAGGFGTRLRPLTDSQPKPMVKISGRPYLEYQLLWLKQSGAKEVLLLVSYLGSKIMNHFKDGSSFGLTIKYSVEKEPMGTAGALKNAERYLDDRFFLINGDSFLPVPLQDIQNAYLSKTRKGMVVVYDNAADTLVRNNISLDRSDIVLKYRKGTQDRDLKYVDAGIGVYDKEILSLIPAKGSVSFENEIYPLLIERKELAAYKTKQRFYDIGTFEQLKRFSEFANSYFTGLD